MNKQLAHRSILMLRPAARRGFHGACVPRPSLFWGAHRGVGLFEAPSHRFWRRLDRHQDSLLALLAPRFRARALGPPGMQALTNRALVPRVLESKDASKIKLAFDLPKAEAAEIDFKLSDGVLTLKSDASASGSSWSSSRTASTSFTVPGAARSGEVHSEWVGDTLHVTIPKETTTSSVKAAAEAAEGATTSVKATDGVAASAETTASATAAAAAPEAWPRQRHVSFWSAFDDFGSALEAPSRQTWRAQMEYLAKRRAEYMLERRRQSMAVDVTQKAEAYDVAVDLPRGTTRGDVKLSLSERNVLEVEVQGKGVRRLALPRDADAEAIAAKFAAEESEAVAVSTAVTKVETVSEATVAASGEAPAAEGASAAEEGVSAAKKAVESGVNGLVSRVLVTIPKVQTAKVSIAIN